MKRGRPVSPAVLRKQRDILLRAYADKVKRHTRGRRSACGALRLTTTALLRAELRESRCAEMAADLLSAASGGLLSLFNQPNEAQANSCRGVSLASRSSHAPHP